MNERLFRVVAPHFVAGLVVRGCKVTHAAPILRWSVGKGWDRVASALNKKGYDVKPLGRGDR